MVEAMRKRKIVHGLSLSYVLIFRNILSCGVVASAASIQKPRALWRCQGYAPPPAAIAASLASVFMLRAVPPSAAEMRSLERPIPSG
jgi:hypothetical protein